MQPGATVAQQREDLDRLPAASREGKRQGIPGFWGAVLVAEDEPPIVLEYPPHLDEAIGQSLPERAVAFLIPSAGCQVGGQAGWAITGHGDQAQRLKPWEIEV